MAGKTCIVTGANAGIGKVTALALAEKGAEVLLVCRNQAKGERARQEIAQSTGNSQLTVYRCDFALPQSIRDCTAKILAAHPKIHVLVNNAGAVFAEQQFTDQDIEMTFAVNHLGYFHFTHLLLDRLKASAPARIVIVSSASHYKGKIDFNDLHFRKRKYHIMRAYEQSKLANVLYSYELARHLEGSGVTVNALHPGVVRTNIGNKSGKWVFAMLWTMLKPFMINTEQGAATSVYLAASPEVEGVSGKFFAKSKQKRSSELSYVRADAKRLWEISLEMIEAGRA